MLSVHGVRPHRGPFHRQLFLLKLERRGAHRHCFGRLPSTAYARPRGFAPVPSIIPYPAAGSQAESSCVRHNIYKKSFGFSEAKGPKVPDLLHGPCRLRDQTLNALSDGNAIWLFPNATAKAKHPVCPNSHAERARHYFSRRHTRIRFPGQLLMPIRQALSDRASCIIPYPAPDSQAESALVVGKARRRALVGFDPSGYSPSKGKGGSAW